ncbi:MAG: aminotransferase class IV [Candidatus Peregrinibacteria bacterium]|nr:aminotransferase class IV [Candidatus Peregrinibacteria bacterium]
MIFCLNGQFIDQKDAKISLLDNGFMFGDAFFDTMRTYKGVILELDRHLARIQKTAKILHLKLPCSMKELESWIKKTSKINKLDQARMRVTISRGEHGFDFLTSKNTTLAITCEPYKKDEKVTIEGVYTFTLNFQRPWPEIKSTNLMPMVQAYHTLKKKKGYEGILVDDLGNVTEGSSTNIFIVKDGEVFTPKDRMLAGVTRNRVIELAKEMKLKMHIENFYKAELFKADEIFLTNRPREIIPVIKVDNKKIGTGKPGAITKKIIAAYKEFTEEHTKSHLKDYI